MADQLEEYRNTLLEGRNAAQDSYDRAILTLSGGALAVALGFVKTAGVPVSRWLLAAACVLFASSLVSVVCSFRLSRMSFDAQLAALDDPLDVERFRRGRPGGPYAGLTEILNTMAFVCLLLGIAALATFVVKNLGR